MTATATEPTTRNGRRGRPRPQLTIRRDEAVAAALKDADGSATRSDLAKRLGESQPDVYRALCRLRDAHRVERVHDGGRHVWRLTA